MSSKQAGRIKKGEASVLLDVLARSRAGDFSARMPLDWEGVSGKVADSLNQVLASNQALCVELERVSRVVGKEGRLSQRVAFHGTEQVWAGCLESVNSLIDDLVRPSKEMQRVIGAVAGGDLSKKVSVDVEGEMLELKETINAMVDQLNGFVSEVSRVAREVGTEGKLGQAAAHSIEVGGVWRDLTDDVNLMAGNLTGQVRDIAEVTTAVANGDLSKKITADVRGEFLELKNTVNAMVDQLNRFAGEVTRVAREVGVEGKLGGQAQSQEVAGVWKDLTDDVNQLAANLTDQVRAIAAVATAVTEGDLTREVTVAASGEVAVLKDKLNMMIGNLRETMRQNTEQDWLKTNLERFARMLQGQRDLATVSSVVLSELAPLVSAQHGVFYALTDTDSGPQLTFQAGYGFQERKHAARSFHVGEGLVGQCALEKEAILLTNVPSDYVRITSGLGEAPPLTILVLPILFEGSVLAVIELASFAPFNPIHRELLDGLAESIGLVLNTVAASSVTDRLLEQAQSQALLLAEKNDEVERKFQEVEAAKRLVETSATELSTTSRYKSEFIANMSHELRTPLNSVLILAEQLADNPDGNLTERQVRYASTIRASGGELLQLLNDVLDIAKVESNTVRVSVEELSLAGLADNMEHKFGPIAEAQGVAFTVIVEPGLPATIRTDPLRLRQVLTNLLANALKFTESGEVTLRLMTAKAGWSADAKALTEAEVVVAISVTDTGIGIAHDDQQIVFEPFAQVDGTTARRYGGTGLGLSISRDLVGLLGGELTLASTLGAGSTFTVLLPAAATLELAAPGPALLTSSSSLVEGDTPSEASPVQAVDRERQRVSRNPTPSYVGVFDGATALIVDDDFRNIFALTALLERGGLSVLPAQSGPAALAMLAERTEIDVVLMDIMMPVMNGYETMSAMRAMPGFGELPIIAVTGKVVGGERERCIAAGASDYIPKPVDTAELLEALSAWFPVASRAPTAVVGT